MDTKKQRQPWRDDARLTESGNGRSEQLNTCGAYRVANQQSLACLPERIRTMARLVFRYEISDLLTLSPVYTHQTKTVSESISDQTPGRTLLGAVKHTTGAPPYLSQSWFHPLSAKFLNETEPIGTWQKMPQQAEWRLSNRVNKSCSFCRILNAVFYSSLVSPVL